MEKIDKKNDWSQLAAIKFLKKPSFFWENFRTLYGNLNKLSQEVDSKNNDSLVDETYKNYPPRELQASGFFSVLVFFQAWNNYFCQAIFIFTCEKPQKLVLTIKNHVSFCFYRGNSYRFQQRSSQRKTEILILIVLSVNRHLIMFS